MIKWATVWWSGWSNGQQFGEVDDQVGNSLVEWASDLWNGWLSGFGLINLLESSREKKSGVRISTKHSFTSNQHSLGSFASYQHSFYSRPTNTLDFASHQHSFTKRLCFQPTFESLHSTNNCSLCLWDFALTNTHSLRDQRTLIHLVKNELDLNG